MTPLNFGYVKRDKPVPKCPRCGHIKFTSHIRNYTGQNVVIIYCARCGCVIGTSSRT